MTPPPPVQFWEWSLAVEDIYSCTLSRKRKRHILTILLVINLASLQEALMYLKLLRFVIRKIWILMQIESDVLKVTVVLLSSKTMLNPMRRKNFDKLCIKTYNIRLEIFWRYSKESGRIKTVSIKEFVLQLSQDIFRVWKLFQQRQSLPYRWHRFLFCYFRTQSLSSLYMKDFLTANITTISFLARAALLWAEQCIPLRVWETIIERHVYNTGFFQFPLY